MVCHVEGRKIFNKATKKELLVYGNVYYHANYGCIFGRHDYLEKFLSRLISSWTCHDFERKETIAFFKIKLKTQTRKYEYKQPIRFKTFNFKNKYQFSKLAFDRHLHCSCFLPLQKVFPKGAFHTYSTRWELFHSG